MTEDYSEQVPIDIIESARMHEDESTQAFVLPLPDPSEEQSRVLDQLLSWARLKTSDLEMTLGGFAGTGKTTVIRHFMQRLQDERLFRDWQISVNAFTGKACSVLRRKGLKFAETLHQLMYVPTQDSETKKLKFVRRYSIDAEFIIVDEASMVSTELLRDLRMYKRKLLFVGDMGQLPPVGNNPQLMLNPRLRLEFIHRQAMDNPVIKFATEIRQGHFVPHSDDARLAFGLKARPADMDPTGLLTYDQVICAMNKTRMDLNRRMRVARGFKQNLNVGDKIICLKNNHELGLFNGLIVWLDEFKDGSAFHKDSWLFSFHDDLGNKWTDIPVWSKPFELGVDPKTLKMENLPKYTDESGESQFLSWFDFAYAITCHKAQGSEWDRVCVVEEYAPPKLWDMKVWRYTAVTRASKELYYVR